MRLRDYRGLISIIITVTDLKVQRTRHRRPFAAISLQKVRESANKHSNKKCRNARAQQYY